MRLTTCLFSAQREMSQIIEVAGQKKRLIRRDPIWQLQREAYENMKDQQTTSNENMKVCSSNPGRKGQAFGPSMAGLVAMEIVEPSSSFPSLISQKSMSNSSPSIQLRCHRVRENWPKATTTSSQQQLAPPFTA